ncbi:element excision factor XisH family protein [Hydrocoleum sp. CS-953]|uniref:element excision factor XisH family protein n=2 Tax=Microcoleaceae TaxID=1892252 RepID=UPI00352B949D
MHEFETALGQYLIYQTFLSLTHPDFKVYLAVGNKIYEKFFAQVAIKLILQKYQVLLLVIDIKKEEIIKWIS